MITIASISETEITNFLLKIVMKTNKQRTNFHVVFVCSEILFILFCSVFLFLFMFSFSLCLTFFDTMKNTQQGQCHEVGTMFA